ncbi:unnamed protein product [Heligmosomoides polygyrus]|uniref:Innexin n=1 Tax=Heligmosomoides polygyrus TaxID=6339 RepID=A0A183FDI3_HELPZ|nr:unnamed protein product [Heligmosomoides polygyrus]
MKSTTSRYAPFISDLYIKSISGAWEQYSENYCFVQNTYFVRPDGYIPDSTVDRENAEIGYYQWVPFILGLQAILFYLPALFWRLFNWQSGVAVKSLVTMARETTDMQPERKREAVSVVGAHIFDSLRVQRKISQYGTLILLRKLLGERTRSRRDLMSFWHLKEIEQQEESTCR